MPTRRRPSGPTVSSLCSALLFLLIFNGSTPSPAHAQGANGSHFALGASFTPTWKDYSTLAENTLGWSHPLEGSEFTIGIGRGSTRGGDWTASYVIKPVEDGSFTETEEFSNTSPPFAFSDKTTTTNTLQDVVMKGVEFNWFRPFGTIKNHVQIGLNVGGGIAKVHGTVEQTVTFESTTKNIQTGAIVQHDVQTYTDSLPASEIFYKFVPLFKAEAAAAFIVVPAFKIKVAGGLNNPSISVRVAAVFLIGAK